MITSKAANGYHPKTGQWRRLGLTLFYHQAPLQGARSRVVIERFSPAPISLDLQIVPASSTDPGNRIFGLVLPSARLWMGAHLH